MILHIKREEVSFEKVLKTIYKNQKLDCNSTSGIDKNYRKWELKS